MAIDTTWTDPSTGGAIDLDAGEQLTAVIWDKVLSNLKRLGGANGELYVTDAGNAFIGDDANAKATAGLTINQGGADDEILAGKSSDVGHADTDDAEADTFFNIRKQHSTNGGLEINGFTDGAGNKAAVSIQGTHGAAADTTKSTAGVGIISATAYEVSGTARTNITADGNVFTVRCMRGGGVVTVFIVDEDGDIHYDGSDAGAYDAHDDGALAADLASVLSGRPEQAKTYDVAALRELKLVNYGADGRTFVSAKQANMLSLGAIKQLHGEAVRARQQIAALKADVVTLKAKVGVV